MNWLTSNPTFTASVGTITGQVINTANQVTLTYTAPVERFVRHLHRPLQRPDRNAQPGLGGRIVVRRPADARVVHPIGRGDDLLSGRHQRQRHEDLQALSRHAPLHVRGRDAGGDRHGSEPQQPTPLSGPDYYLVTATDQTPSTLASQQSSNQACLLVSAKTYVINLINCGDSITFGTGSSNASTTSAAALLPGLIAEQFRRPWSTGRGRARGTRGSAGRRRRLGQRHQRGQRRHRDRGHRPGCPQYRHGPARHERREDGQPVHPPPPTSPTSRTSATRSSRPGGSRWCSRRPTWCPDRVRVPGTRRTPCPCSPPIGTSCSHTPTPRGRRAPRWTTPRRSSSGPRRPSSNSRPSSNPGPRSLQTGSIPTTPGTRAVADLAAGVIRAIEVKTGLNVAYVINGAGYERPAAEHHLLPAKRRRSSGVQPHHRPSQRRVRPQWRSNHQYLHQAGHEPLPRRCVRVLPRHIPEYAQLLPEGGHLPRRSASCHPTHGDLPQNIYGGTVGGPVLKDRLFFFFGYQGTHQAIPQTGGNVRVFSPAQLAGNYTGTTFSNNVIPQTISIPGCVSGTTTWKNCFTTGQVPVSAFNSVATNLVKTYVPAATSGTNVYTFSPITGQQDQPVHRPLWTSAPRRRTSSMLSRSTSITPRPGPCPHRGDHSRLRRLQQYQYLSVLCRMGPPDQLDCSQRS